MQGNEDEHSLLTLFLCLAAGAPRKTLLTEKTAASLVRKLRKTGLQPELAATFIREHAPGAHQDGYLALWNGFVQDAQKTLCSDMDYQLHDALALRCKVFILEQGPYQDPDGADKQSWHLLGYDGAGALQACLRVVDPGVNYPEPSIGRVVTAKEARGGGTGRLLMQEGLARCRQLWPGRSVRISAQAHLQRFYGSLGFVAVSDEYLEDDIPHIEMLWSSP